MQIVLAAQAGGKGGGSNPFEPQALTPATSRKLINKLRIIGIPPPGK
jgi:hypothetical protein